MEAGLLAEFADEEELLAAIRLMRQRGYTDLDIFTPYPVARAEQALGLRRSPLGRIIFPLGLTAAAVGYLIQWYCNAVSYPLDVGGRPAHAPPAFIPITFETMVLVSAVSGFLLLWVFLGLPRLHHPISEIDGFRRASIDRFFLAVGRPDPLFDGERTARDFTEAGARQVDRFGADESAP